MKKKICVVILNRANFARIKTVLIELKKQKNLQVEVILGGSAILEKYGDIENEIKSIGIIPYTKLLCVVDGTSLESMTKTVGVLLIEISTIFSKMKPVGVLTVADRHETIATAIAARYMNISLIHTQGGEVTGSVDNSVRNAISMMADYHFPATSKSKSRLIKMGIDKKKVFNFGCPSLDLISRMKFNRKNLKKIMKYGVGKNIDFSKKYIVVLQHSDTDEYLSSKKQITQTLLAIHNLNLQTIWLWPNVDAGSDIFSKELRKFREKKKLPNLHFIKNLPPEDYANMINYSNCIVGNSSSAIREGSFLGIPAVNIGSRQKNREIANNVKNVNYDHNKIETAIKKQINKKHLSKNYLYGKGNAGRLIAKKINQIFENDK